MNSLSGCMFCWRVGATLGLVSHLCLVSVLVFAQTLSIKWLWLLFQAVGVNGSEVNSCSRRTLAE